MVAPARWTGLLPFPDVDLDRDFDRPRDGLLPDAGSLRPLSGSDGTGVWSGSGSCRDMDRWISSGDRRARNAHSQGSGRGWRRDHRVGKDAALPHRDDTRSSPTKSGGPDVMAGLEGCSGATTAKNQSNRYTIVALDQRTLKWPVLCRPRGCDRRAPARTIGRLPRTDPWGYPYGRSKVRTPAHQLASGGETISSM